MDRMENYIESLKKWAPEPDFGTMYSNVISRGDSRFFLIPSALKLSAAFAVLFVVLLTGLYFGSGPSGTSDGSPMAYIIGQDAHAGNGPVGYILGE